MQRQWKVFLQNNLLNFKKRDTKNTQTYHYILLTKAAMEGWSEVNRKDL